MPGRSRWVSSLSFVVLVSGCGAGGPGDRSTEWVGTREMVGSVEVVRSPSWPLYDAEAVRLTRLWSLEAGLERDGAEPLEWEAPIAIRPSATGSTAWIGWPPGSRSFAPATGGPERRPTRPGTGRGRSGLRPGAEGRAGPGRSRRRRGGRSVGRRGRGPGELEGPTGVAVFEDAFVVANLGRASFEVFDSVGEYRRSVPAGAMVFALHPLPTGRLLVSAFTGREGRWTSFEADGSAGPTLEWPSNVTAKDAVVDGCERVGTAGPHVFRWSCTVPYLQVVDTSGALLREILADREAEETGREALAAAVE